MSDDGPGSPHPTLQLDDTVHQRVRLGILAVLQETKRADFSSLRDVLGLSDGNLARHLDVLAQAGLVTIAKDLKGSRPRTWISATGAGRKALAAEVTALRRLIDSVETGP
ncbi:MAG: transcriptional regulator [Solirubrobacterales bacterium]